MKFIIEHLDPELYDWCFLEYKHLSQKVGKGNVLFTNLKSEEAQRLKQYGEVTSRMVSELNLKDACILDPYANDTLKPTDREKFSSFIFGGILGNNPAQKRTELLTKALHFPTRNLGAHQLSTDTAVYVAKKILDGTPLEKIRFVEEVEIVTTEGESTILPFRYVIDNGKLIISSELVDHIKKLEEF